MHDESMKNMSRAIEQFAEPLFSEIERTLYVVDIGAKDFNGSYRELFNDPRVDYLGIDVEEGEGVDLVLQDPYSIELPDACADLVISGQQLEHCEFFWLSLKEMARIVKPGGLLILIVPSTGYVHRFPVDCYRFLPDSMAAFSRLMECELLESWQDESSEWGDLVGVFKKPGNLADGDILYVHQGQNYVSFLESYVGKLASQSHLEIGSATGNSLKGITCPTIAIDPKFQIKDNLLENKQSCLFFQMPSDDFFSRYDPAVLLQRKLDTAFLDGMHLFEYLLRDFINTEKACHEHSTIFMHDCLPTTVAMAKRDPAEIAHTGPTAHWWTGDVWKVVEILKQYRDDLDIVCYDCDPTGLVKITSLDPENTSLTSNYERIVKEFSEIQLTTRRLKEFLDACEIRSTATRKPA